MTKLIPVLAIGFLFAACNEAVKPKEDRYLVKSDSLERLKLLKHDTTRLDIDGLKSSPANFRLLLENKHVRVLEYSLKPGQKDTPHTHPPKSSYVVSGGKLKVYLDNGQMIIADEDAGTASWSDYVGKHYVENIGNTTVVIVVTEIKSLK